MPDLNVVKGFVKVSFDHRDSTLCITIEDNGPGIRAKNRSVADTDSFGLKLSHKRIKTFQQLFETNIVLTINNINEKQTYPGTRIELYINPYENKNTGLHH